MEQSELTLRLAGLFGVIAGVFALGMYVACRAREEEMKATALMLIPFFDPGSLRVEPTPFLTFSLSGATATGTRNGRRWTAFFSRKGRPGSAWGRRRRHRPMLYTLDLTVEAAEGPRVFSYTSPAAYEPPEVDSLIRRIESGMSG